MKKLVLSAFAAALLAGTATADDKLSYSYIEVGYDWIATDGDADFEGPYIEGAIELGEQFYLPLSFTAGEVELQVFGADFDVDVDVWSAGLGYHTPISRQTDLFGEVSYVEFDADGPSADGFDVELGFRSQVSSNLESRLSINYLEIDDDDRISLNGGLLVEFDQFGLDFDLGVDEDGDVGGQIGLRLNF